MNSSSRIKIVLVALLAGGLLTACGKRGALEPPPGSQQAQGAEQGQGGKKKEAPAAPKRSLPIDFILD